MGKPKIRFKGFTDDWEQRKLGEVAEKVYGGGTPKTSEEEFWGGNIPWFQSADLHEHEVQLAIPKKAITALGLQKSAAQLVPGNSIAIVTRVGVGKLVFMPFSYATSQDFLSLSELNIDGKFGCYAIYRLLQREKNLTQGTSIKGITKDEILQKKIVVPNKIEQKKIGDYFTGLDNLITLHQRKCDEVKTLKKYMLQKMFPQNGMNVPEIRFSGFTDVWEQRKLGEVAEKVYGGGTPKTSEEEFWGGNIPWFQSADLHEHEVQLAIPKKAITALGLQKSAAQLVPGNSIAIVTRVGVGKLVFMPFSYATSQDFLSLSELNIDGKFGCYAIYRLLQREKNLTQGTSIKGITKDEILQKKIVVPNKIEQKKIGDYFTGLDNLITLHQRKCNELRKMKKFMLQNMFPKD